MPDRVAEPREKSAPPIPAGTFASGSSYQIQIIRNGGIIARSASGAATFVGSVEVPAAQQVSIP